jgi:hypothetical protein
LGKLPQPGPEYKPDQVVQIVMDSLQHNDQDDSGIATTFNFASPGNKKYTGPLEKFTAMVKTTAYKPMLNCKSIEYGAMQIEGDRAQQVVTLVDSADQTAHYLFRLSRQTDGPFKNCWMTDGVIRVEPRPIGDRPARRTV